MIFLIDLKRLCVVLVYRFLDVGPLQSLHTSESWLANMPLQSWLHLRIKSTNGLQRVASTLSGS